MTGPRARLALVLAALCVAAALAGGAAGQSGAPRAVSDPTAPAAAEAVRGLVAAVAQDVEALQRQTDLTPAPRPTLTEDEVTEIAGGSGRLQDWIAGHPIARSAAEFESDDSRWKVSYVSKDGDGEEKVEAQVFVADRDGTIAEVRTGPQVAWMMARGTPGAFGRAINREAIWITLSLLFLLPLLSVRRLISWRTLDLAVLLSFSISLIWFNRGEIFTSVPLAYPPLVYLGARLAWIGLRRRRPRGDEAGSGGAEASVPSPRFAGWAPTWVLFSAMAVALGLRYGLNAFDSNVIDVGYAGVIGADRITDGITPYGTFPSDCGSCDTYGPLNYLAYVPFEAVQPWTGTWDALPAAHGAAVMFDVLAVAGMVVLGWSLSSLRLGAALGLAWAAFPFTGFALATNANDTLVAATLIWGLVLARRPAGRGLALGLSIASKFGPAVLLPLWSRQPFPRPGPGRGRRLLWYGGGLAAAAVLVGWVLLLDGDGGVRAFWSRTIGYQLGRDSPFSIWGQYPALRPLQLALMAGVAIAALLALRYPRRMDLLRMTALSGALVIGVELTMTHWFYLYIPWFLPFAFLALVPEWRRPRQPPRAPATAAPARERRRAVLSR